MTARSLATSVLARDLDATRQLQAPGQQPTPAKPAAAGPLTARGHYNRARSRAGARLARAHPAEFTRYLQEELSAGDKAAGAA